MKRLILLLLIMTTANAISAAPLQEGFVDDSHPLLVYSGTWQAGTYSEAYGGGNYQFVDDEIATVSFETFATGVTIFFIYDPSGDDVEICVDSDCTTFSTLGAVNVGTIELSDLSNDVKTITLSKVTADTSVFAFDALYIHPSNESEASTESILEFDYDGQTYSGVLDFRITSGDALIILMQVIIASFLMFSLILQIGNK